jgi:glycosyltransferase involved in cell wall biosynthesis
MNIDFIIPTYNRPEHLVTLLGSLMAQSSDRWRAHVVVDCPPQETIDRLKQIESFFNDNRIKWTYLDKRHNDWGHTPRQYGVDNSTEQWVVMTGEDNYYTPVFVEEVLKEITPKVHFIYTDMVHNWINKQYILVKTAIQLGRIDMGCYVTRTKNAKQVRLKTQHEWADWYFVEDYLKQFPDGKVKKIDKVIYVHN